MAISERPCWSKEQALTVLNTDAEKVDREVFLAVHSNRPVWRVDPNDSKKRTRISPNDLLQKLQDPGLAHFQMAVTGSSGAGKSHLVQWLHLNLPPRADLQVLSIPRGGTSLRKILDLLIHQVPPEGRTKYQERLDAAGFHTETPDQRKRRLISELALAIGSDEGTSEEENYFIEKLPTLFSDPHLLSLYQCERGAVFDELVSHITTAPHEYMRNLVPRQLTRGDLPLSGVEANQMAAETRRFLARIIPSEREIDLCLNIANRNLSKAVARTLNFTADQLGELMEDVRRALKSQGRSLVLLIEDFAQVQGLDNALLQALIEKADSRNGLCDLRWAMAITDGFFERLPDTVKTRMDYVVDIDPPQVEPPSLAEVASFSARYLNASRLSQEGLTSWCSKLRKGDGYDLPPNACADCLVQEECHRVFGQSAEGYGYYPFTEYALYNLAENKGALGERFNPRALLKDVVREVLVDRIEDLRSGLFPPKGLRSHFLSANVGLSPSRRQELERSDRAHGSRQADLLELWCDIDSGPHPPGGVFEAFGLPVPKVPWYRPADSLQGGGTQGGGTQGGGTQGGGTQGSGTQGGGTQGSGTQGSGTQGSGTQGGGTQGGGTQGDGTQGEGKKQVVSPSPVIEAIRAWGRGASLPQKYNDELRQLVFEAVTSWIDWDAEGLERSAFASPSGNTPFKQRHIVFVDLETQGNIPGAGVGLMVPDSLGPDRISCALAIEGLYECKHRGGWMVPGGPRQLHNVTCCLDHWSRSLVDQFKAWPSEGQGWDYVSTTLEVLYVGAVLSGRLPVGDFRTEDLVVRAFEPWVTSIDSPNTCDSVRKVDLFKKLGEDQSTLKQILSAWASGTKGGSAGDFLDAERLLRVAEAIRRDWTPQHRPPENLRVPEYKKAAALHRRVCSELPKLKQQQAERLRSAGKILGEWSSQGTLEDVLDEIDGLRKLVLGSGLAVSNDCVAGLQEALDQTRAVLAPVASDILRFGTQEAVDLAVLVSSPVQGALDALDRIALAAKRFTDQTTGKVDTERNRLDTGSLDLRETRERIGRGLESLELTLTEIGSGHA